MSLAYHVTCYEKGLLTIMFTLLHINLTTCGQQGIPLKSLSPVDQTRDNAIQREGEGRRERERLYLMRVTRDSNLSY